MRTWLSIALSRPTVLRALKAAALVGALQIAINHGDNLLRGEVDAVRVLKMCLTASVPYLVSTFSSVGAVLHLRRGAAPSIRGSG